MAENELIIDDEYCASMASYFYAQGNHLNIMVKNYIDAVEKVKSNAIKEGEVAEALEAYITYVKKLDEQIKEISIIVKKQVEDFLTQIDDADEYLF